MKDIFLNKNLKENYMIDFQKVLTFDQDFWRIDVEFLKNCLNKINSNQEIQTLYSSYGNQNPNETSSYLNFTFSDKVEAKLLRKIIPDLIYFYNKQNDGECFCWYQYFEPKSNSNFRERDEEFGLACLDNKNYFMVNHIKIQIETYDIMLKEKFWKEITEILTEIN